jgi:hypothetical protein
MNSKFAQDPKHREMILESVAVESLRKKGILFDSSYKSRKVTIDPDNPNRVIIKQVNSSGQIQNASMEINSITGQAITSYYQEDTSGNKSIYFDNGSVEIKSDRLSGSTTTNFKYSAEIMAGRSSIEQVVSDTGVVATELRTNKFHKTGLLYGIDALNDTANFTGNYAEEMVTKEILAKGSSTGSTTVNVDFLDHSYDDKKLFNDKGDINDAEMRDILNSNIGGKAEYRTKIMEKVAQNWAKKHNKDITGWTTTSGNPDELIFINYNSAGQEVSRITMKVDSTTGATTFT